MVSQPTETSPQRILHLVNTVGGRGNGIVHVAVDLAVEQARAGLEVYVAGRKGSYTSHLMRSGVHYIPLRQTSWWRLPNPLALARTMQLVRQHHIQIVHAHNMTGAVIGRLASMLNGAMSRPKVRVVTTVHNSWAPHARLMSAGHRVIAVTAAVRDEMVDRGIPSRKITVVINGPIGTTRVGEGYAPVPPITLVKPAVLTVAGMYERKGIRDLIDATVILSQQVPNVMTYIVGDGPDRTKFEVYARKRGMDKHVTFLGFRPDARNLMSQANAFVLASHAEPAALVLAEARSIGVPVIASNVGGMPEMLDHGAGGLLVPPRDPASLAETLARLLLDPAHAADMSRRALAGIERFHVSRMSRETVDVYREAFAL